MKILFVSPEYPFPKPSGGIASYVRDIAKGLAQLGHDIKIICVDVQYAFKSPTQIVDDEGVAIHFVSKEYCHRSSKILENNRIRGMLGRLLPDTSPLIPAWNAYRYYAELSISWQPDIIETFDWMACGFFISLLEKKIPMVFRGGGHAKVIVENNGGAWSNYYEAQHRLERWTARKSTMIVPCSQLLGQDEINHFQVPQEKIVPVANCADMDLFKSVDVRSARNDDVIKVVYVGKIETRKGFDLLLEAGRRLHRKYPQIHYYFIGRDCVDVKDYLDKADYEKDYLDNVHFTGLVPRDELQNYLTECDFAVFPSRYEPFGIVAIEAMACGLPVIVSDLGGWREAVTDMVTGTIFRSSDVESLIAAMEKLILAGPHQRMEMGCMAKKVAKERYSIGAISREMEKIYLKLVSETTR